MPERATDEQSRDDLEWCHDAVQRVSRTFALTVSELEEPLTHYICVGYLLCRIADTIEDATHIPPEAQQRLLDAFRAALDPDADGTVAEFRADVDEWIPDDPNDDWQVVADVERVARPFHTFDEDVRAAMRPPIIEMADGMAMFVGRYEDVGGLRIGSIEELEEYCWYVAGTVGELITNLLAPVATDEQEQKMRRHARDFALLLQIVNIAKDVRPDYSEEDNVYAPQSLLADHDLDPEDIDDAENADAFAPVVRSLADHAEQYADGAEAWLEAMPEKRGNTLSAVAVPFLLAIATLRELEDRPEDAIVEGEVKVDRGEVLALLECFQTGNPDIAALRERMRNQPLHQ